MANQRSDHKESATRIVLADGEDSIANARFSTDGTYLKLVWRIRLPGHTESRQVVTRVRADQTQGALRAKARAKAKSMLAENRSGSKWTLASPMADYIQESVMPKIAMHSDLSPRSKETYFRIIRRLLGQCSDDPRPHRYSLDKVTIGAAANHDFAVNCLMEIAEFHGLETSRQAFGLYRGKILKPLAASQVIDSNLLMYAQPDLRSVAKPSTRSKSGVIALDEDDYGRSLEWMLEHDPTTHLAPGKVGRWDFDELRVKYINALNLTLLQAASGLRQDEARLVRGYMFRDSEDGLAIDLPAEITKGSIERISWVLDPDVADRMRGLLADLSTPADLLFPQPADQSKLWARERVTRETRPLYQTMNVVLGIEEFEKGRSHLWRATLNEMLKDTISQEARAAQFGHTAAVNVKSYTRNALTGPEATRASSRIKRGPDY